MKFMTIEIPVRVKWDFNHEDVATMRVEMTVSDDCTAQEAAAALGYVIQHKLETVALGDPT